MSPGVGRATREASSSFNASLPARGSCLKSNLEAGKRPTSARFLAVFGPAGARARSRPSCVGENIEWLDVLILWGKVGNPNLRHGVKCG